MKNKNAFLLSFEFPPHPGGIGSYGASLASSISEKYDTTVFCLDHDPEASKKYDKSQDYEIIRFKKSKFRILDIVQRYITFYKHYLNIRPDTVIVNNNSTLVLLIFALLCFKQRCFVVGHGLEFTMMHGLKGRLYKFLLSHVEKIVPNSEYTKKLLLRNTNVDDEHVRMIFPCADEQTYYPQKVDVDDDIFRIITVGRVGRRKNHELTFRAISILPENIKPKIRYDIVGIGPDIAKLTQLAKDLGVAELVQFRGFLESDEIRDLLNKADLFTMPSKNFKKTTDGDVEGFGIVLVEANFCKTPVVGSYDNGTESAVKEGINGFLVDFEDYQSLSHIISRLYSNQEELLSLKESAYVFAIENFTTEIFKNAWLNLIDHE